MQIPEKEMFYKRKQPMQNPKVREYLLCLKYNKQTSAAGAAGRQETRYSGNGSQSAKNLVRHCDG